jgi:hypothetical protein
MTRRSTNLTPVSSLGSFAGVLSKTRSDKRGVRFTVDVPGFPFSSDSRQPRERRDLSPLVLPLAVP